MSAGYAPQMNAAPDVNWTGDADDEPAVSPDRHLARTSGPSTAVRGLLIGLTFSIALWSLVISLFLI
ncbi:MAG: hypothetical protein WA906_12520 [Pacificimonas sp.]